MSNLCLQNFSSSQKRQGRGFGVFIVIFEHISHVFLVNASWEIEVFYTPGSIEMTGFNMIGTLFLNWLLTHSFPMHLFSTTWKHQKFLRFSDVFRGQRKSALGTNGLTRLLRSESLPFNHISGKFQYHT